MMALGLCEWTLLWNKIHSSGYGLREEQVHACKNKSGPKY